MPLFSLDFQPLLSPRARARESVLLRSEKRKTLCDGKDDGTIQITAFDGDFLRVAGRKLQSEENRWTGLGARAARGRACTRVTRVVRAFLWSETDLAMVELKRKLRFGAGRT